MPDDRAAGKRLQDIHIRISSPAFSTMLTEYCSTQTPTPRQPTRLLACLLMTPLSIQLKGPPRLPPAPAAHAVAERRRGPTARAFDFFVESSFVELYREDVYDLYGTYDRRQQHGAAAVAGQGQGQQQAAKVQVQVGRAGRVHSRRWPQGPGYSPLERAN